MINKINKILLCTTFLTCVLFLSSVNYIFASDEPTPPSITIINPIRGKELGHEKDNLLESLKAQWKVTKDTRVNATWLLQYSVLEDEDIVNYAKNKMPNQEFGLLFEIDRNFAKKSGVLFRGQGPWYFSDGLFLVSYDVYERKKLIDTAFTKFKENFGYYPKTVGAWWIGGDSISYMQKKYGITSVLRASDQFDLDFYSIWGTPWSIPYISSREHQGIPAKSFEESSRVVNLQWAARDPTDGYEDPLFSLQDYPQKGYDTKYVNHLLSVLLKHSNDNIVIGLENGGTLSTFEGYYKTILSEAKKLQKEKKVKIELAKNFSREFIGRKRIFSDTPYFLANDFDSDNQSFWYNSEYYRAGIRKEGNKTYIIDLKDYGNKIEEDFTYLPNSQSRLRISTPSFIDSMRFPEQKKIISEVNNPLTIREEKGYVSLLSGEIKIASFSKENLKIFFSSGVKNFNFSLTKDNTNLPVLLLLIYFAYLVVLYVKRTNFIEVSFSLILLLIPFFLSIMLLRLDSVFAFDRKELILLQFLPIGRFLPVENSLIIMKIIFLLLLLVAHYIFYIFYNLKQKRIIYFLIFIFITFLFVNIPYFPLDSSTYTIVLLAVGSFCVSIFVVLSIIFLKTRLKIILKAFIFPFPLFLLLVFLIIFLSRSIYVLAPFEIEALEFIKQQNKNIYYVSQVDYSIYPIYKGVKPLIYYEPGFAEKLTGKSWTKVERPEDNIIKLTNYDDKLIVVPRYLGADISSYEIENHKIKKIFDNAQIAIYEKE